MKEEEGMLTKGRKGGTRGRRGIWREKKKDKTGGNGKRLDTLLRQNAWENQISAKLAGRALFTGRAQPVVTAVLFGRIQPP
jgi:hypothetical protein